MFQHCCDKTFSETGKTIENYKLFEILGFIYYSAGIRNEIGLIVKMPLFLVTAKTFLSDKRHATSIRISSLLHWNFKKTGVGRIKCCI